jgi:hypothetical protein
MFPGRRCRVKPRRWTPSVPRGTSGPPPGGARIYRGHVRGPNTTLRAIFSRPARWIDRRPTPVAALRHVPARGQIGSTRPTPAVGALPTHGSPTSRLAGPERPGHWPRGPASASDPVAAGLSPDDRRATSGCSTWNRGRVPPAHGSLCSTWNTRTAGQPRRARLASERRPTLPAPASDHQDQHRKGGSRGRRTIALPTRPRCRAAGRDDQSLDQPVLYRLPSSPLSRAPVQLAPPPCRRAGVLLPGGRPGLAPPQQPPERRGRSVASRCFPGSGCRARPPGGRQGAQEEGLARRRGRCPSIRANSSASSLDDVPSTLAGRRADRSTWNSPSAGESLGVSTPTRRPRLRTAVAWRARRRDAGTDRGTDE